MKLQGKTALITGGTAGIGLETAKRMQAEGARVIITGTNQERIHAAIATLGAGALGVRADVRQNDELDALFATIGQHGTQLDIVFANAGAGTASPLEDVTAEQIDEQFGINFKGLFFTIQKAVPLMRQGGSIVLTTSFLNQVGAPGLSILSASKAAVRSLARSLGAELAPKGIRVNALSPGPISTGFHGKLGLSEAQLSAAAAGIEAQVPLQRFGNACEVARAALFLASDDSSYMTGAELVVDGGLTQI